MLEHVLEAGRNIWLKIESFQLLPAQKYYFNHNPTIHPRIEVTGAEDYYYIGHSMGTLTYFTACNYQVT